MKKVGIAVVGATGLVGEAVIELLAERLFPFGQLFALATGRSAGRRIRCGAASVKVTELSSFDFRQADIAIFCAGEAVSAEYGSGALDAGCSVVDVSTHYGCDPEVPLVLPELNGEALGDLVPPVLVANPTGISVALSLVLEPIRQHYGLESVDVVACEAVSSAGRDGVEELATQTAALLNVQQITSNVFPKQIAFNMLPSVGDTLEDGSSRLEHAVVEQTRRLLDLPNLSLGATVVQAPVFFGGSMAIHLQLDQEAQLSTIEGVLQQMPAITVTNPGKTDGYPTAVTDAAQGDAVYVGRIRKDLSRPRGLNLWVVADNIRRGAALNSVQIAEILVKGYH